MHTDVVVLYILAMKMDMRLVILTLQGRIKAFSVGTKDAAELRPRELCKQFNLSAHCTDGCLA